MAGDAEGQRFVVAALENIEFAGGEQVEILKEIEEAFVFFVDAENFRRIAGLQFGEKHAALFAKLRYAATDRDAVRARFVARRNV